MDMGSHIINGFVTAWFATPSNIAANLSVLVFKLLKAYRAHTTNLFSSVRDGAPQRHGMLCTGGSVELNATLVIIVQCATAKLSHRL
jgi:hypothetical protein